MNENNKLIKKFAPSFITAFFNALGCLFLSLLVAVFAQRIHNYLFIIAAALMLVTVYRFLKVATIRYYLYEEIIVVKKGVFAVQYDSLELYRVKDYRVGKTLIERVFGLMTVTLYTTDISSPTLLLKGIEQSNVAQQIRGLVQVCRLKNRIFEIN